MNRLAISVLASIAAAIVLVAGCTQAAPVPTAAPAAPTKAPAAPTTAPAAPTAVPAKKVDYPVKGKTVTVIVPYAAGGGTHIAAKMLTALWEKELGATYEVVNRPGGGTQVGLTELTAAKPDGYTLGWTVLPTALNTYLEAERKAVFNRKSFQNIANQYDMPYLMTVLASSPYKTVKDVVDAAKAKPETVKVGTTGLMGLGHLCALQLQKSANVKFALVHFDGTAPEIPAFLGGHVDVGWFGPNDLMGQWKAGEVRVLGTSSAWPEILPGIPTFESQGYKVTFRAVGGVSAPAGISKDIVDLLTTTTKKVLADREYMAKMSEMGFPTRYMDPDQYAKYWDETEAELKPFVLEQAQAK